MPAETAELLKVNLVQKVSRWLFAKAIGFPTWNAAGPWPSCVISAFSGGDSVMQLSTVYACVRVRGQTLGSLPCSVYRRGADREMTELRDHWLWPILHDSPDKYRTHFEFFELMERSFCLWGNAYALKARMGKRVVGLNFLDPSHINVRWDTRKGLVYSFTSLDGKYNEYGPDDVLHVKNFSSNGLWGDSPIRNYSINHAIEAQDYGRFFLQNLGRPGGYLKFKGKRPANEEAANKLRADWQSVHGGTANAGKTGVLWDGGEYIPISIPPEDAQYIQTRAFSQQEIAGGIYGVPLNLIGQTDKTATYASAEQFDLGYTKHTVRPQARRFEEALKKSLLATEPDVVVEFDLEELQRGDTAALSQLAATLTQNGIATRNEMRPKFNLPRVENPAADELTLQVNMQMLDRLNEPVQQPDQNPQPGDGPDQQDQNVEKTRYVLVDRRRRVGDEK